MGSFKDRHCNRLQWRFVEPNFLLHNTAFLDYIEEKDVSSSYENVTF